MQILVIVVVGLIYALNAILKAKSGKTQQKDAKQPPARPQRKPPQTMREARPPVRPTKSLSQLQLPKRKLARPAPAAQQTAPLPHQTAEIPELAFPTPQLKPDIEQLPQYTTQTLKKLKKMQTKHLTRTPERLKVQPPHVSAPILDIADADELRRAILHYEILGRPLSLRDPSQRMFAL